MFLKPKKSANPKMTVIFFHHAGGSAQTFRSWIPYLPDSWDPWFYEYPGRGIRDQEPLVSDISILVDSLVLDVKNIDLDKTLFVGHSMGSLVAFELARNLSSQGYGEPWLSLLAERNPSWFIDENIEKRSELSDVGFVDVLIKMGGTNPDVLKSDYFHEYFLPVVRNDFSCVEKYRMKDNHPQLSKDILVLGGQEDMEAPLFDVRQWSKVTTGHCQVVDFAGGHFFYENAEDQVIGKIRRFVRASTRKSAS